MLTQRERHTTPDPVVIIGGGLAGLTAAIYLARTGRPVTVLEKARQVGGRATSQNRSGFLFNLGPHALYIGGGGSAVLAELGIQYQGGQPALDGLAMVENRLLPLPATPSSMWHTSLLNMRQKLALLRILGTAVLTRPAAVAHLSLAEWIASQTQAALVDQLLQTLARVTTYANAPHQLSAAVFLQQLQLTQRHNVRYLDGGWQTLVDSLHQAASDAGAAIMTGAHASHIQDHPQRPSVHLADGRQIPANAVIVAVDPVTASRLLPGNEALQTAARTAIPVRAAALDVALTSLPQPKRPFALGIDQPLYLSAHSAVARLAPAGGALVHVAKYLPLAPTAAADDQHELEGFLDLVQPGWRQVVVEKRFLPTLTVNNYLPLASDGGLAGRPGYAVPGSQRLYLAGDWVGPHGWLTDASLVSGQQAAALVQSLPAAQAQGLAEAVSLPLAV